MLKALVERPDGLFLGHNLAAVILNHCFALMLKALIGSLRLNQLSLELLKLDVINASSSSERFSQVTTHRLALLKGRADRRFRATSVAANLSNAWLVLTIRDTSVTSALEVSGNHLSQCPNDLGQVGPVGDFVLQIR